METFMHWLKCAGIRAIKTMAQTMSGMLVGAIVLSDVNWKLVLSASLLSGIASLITSIAGIPEVENGKNLKRLIKEGK